jgi:acyl dehydratase
VLVETGKIREYAAATAATAAEYAAPSGAPMPPTFLSTVVFWEDLTEVFDTPAARAAFVRAGITPDVRRLLSLEQEYLIHRDYPRAGDELATSVRFERAEVKDGRSARMLLLRFAVDFADGEELVATARYLSAYLETAAGPDPDDRRAPDRGTFAEAAGEALPSRTFGPISITDIVRYQGASGDFNPMHHDDELARSAGYPAAFSVGMLGAGYLATYCVDLFGVESVRRLRTSFRGLVFRGETLTACGWLTTTPSGRQLRLVLENMGGVVVLDAEAELA